VPVGTTIRRAITEFGVGVLTRLRRMAASSTRDAG